MMGQEVASLSGRRILSSIQAKKNRLDGLSPELPAHTPTQSGFLFRTSGVSPHILHQVLQGLHSGVHHGSPAVV